MKIISILIVLLLLAVGIKADDTTRAYCGECVVINPPLDSLIMPVWTVWYNGCELNPINCHWECIDGDLYRICVEEKERDLTIQYKIAWGRMLDTNFLSEEEIKEAVKQGILEAWHTPLVEEDDRQAIISRTAHKKADDLEGSVCSTWLEGKYSYWIEVKPDTIQVCDTTFLFYESPECDSLISATYFNKALFLHIWHKIVCRDSVVVR